jgi:hypothetical protein
MLYRAEVPKCRIILLAEAVEPETSFSFPEPHCPKSILDICQRPQSSLKPTVKIGNSVVKTKLLCKFLKIT